MLTISRSARVKVVEQNNGIIQITEDGAAIARGFWQENFIKIASISTAQ